MSSSVLAQRFLLLLALPACVHSLTSALQPFEAVEPHMGTLFRLKLYASDAATAQKAFAAAFTRVAELEAIMSDYQPDTELNRLTRNAVGHPIPISPDLLRVLLASQKLAEQTNGKFDVTIGPLTHLWRKAKQTHQIPDANTTAAARAHCGFGKLHLNGEHSTASLDEAGMQLDLGAIAKGDAADQALQVLSRQGIGSALVAASGDLAMSAAPPGQAGWKVGLDSYDQPDVPFTRVLLLHDAAVSTSGPSEQHLEVNGKEYSHIIDPQSGLGLQGSLTVTVIARTGIDADSYATAVSVLGPEAGLALIESKTGASAILLTGKQLLQSARFALLRTAS